MFGRYVWRSNGSNGHNLEPTSHCNDQRSKSRMPTQDVLEAKNALESKLSIFHACMHACMIMIIIIINIMVHSLLILQILSMPCFQNQKQNNICTSSTHFQTIPFNTRAKPCKLLAGLLDQFIHGSLHLAALTAWIEVFSRDVSAPTHGSLHLHRCYAIHKARRVQCRFIAPGQKKVLQKRSVKKFPTLVNVFFPHLT